MISSTPQIQIISTLFVFIHIFAISAHSEVFSLEMETYTNYNIAVSTTQLYRRIQERQKNSHSYPGRSFRRYWVSLFWFQSFRHRCDCRTADLVFFPELGGRSDRTRLFSHNYYHWSGQRRLFRCRFHWYLTLWMAE